MGLLEGTDGGNIDKYVKCGHIAIVKCQGNFGYYFRPCFSQILGYFELGLTLKPSVMAKYTNIP